MTNESETEVGKRLASADEMADDWKLWGPYLAERAWGTVREDYSPDGSAWEYFPFEHSHLRTYRWNEDGLGGISDRGQDLCFALALWNGNDPILKERLFGLTGNQGNHGEDVKEYYYYLESTPTHCYMRYLYKYPHAAFPYKDLVETNVGRDKQQGEYELVDTGVFDAGYFDVYIEYAKAAIADICIRIRAINRGPQAAPLHVLPTLWFRNTWTWYGPGHDRPVGSDISTEGRKAVSFTKDLQSNYNLYFGGDPEVLFCENETDHALYGTEGPQAYSKNGINNYIVNGNAAAVNPDRKGTKTAGHYRFDLDPGEERDIYLRLTRDPLPSGDFERNCKTTFELRRRDADAYYETIIPAELNDDERNVMRQSLAGLLWSKQYYYYTVKEWLDGDIGEPPPPASRLTGRNSGWQHVYCSDVMSMPDTWEYPWFAAWDTAFHCIPLALVDPGFAKRQLIVLLREWYMHPNGQIPAYEWAFSDVNPPVHAWAALRVYQIEKRAKGKGDVTFLARVFQKLLLNFTWWVNQKDEEGNNLFEGGFLGLDNIGIFDRSKPLPDGGTLEQSDGTSWMAMYCLNLLAIALELAQHDHAYEDVATKFFEHFVYISDAMNKRGELETRLWDEEDGFYYDVLHLQGQSTPIRIRSLVGLIPLFAVETIDGEVLEKLPDFKRRTDWLLENRSYLIQDVACLEAREGGRRLLAITDRERLRRILRIMLDENEFLSEFGIRSLSRFHKDHPYILRVDGVDNSVSYEPAESRSGMFGGNSNWRGPVWFPVNFLLLESLQKFDHFLGPDFKVEYPTGSGTMLSLWDISLKLEKRLCKLFLRGSDGRRPFNGENETFQNDPHWRDNLLFYEYFDGDTGRGLGASHQTGWTALVAKMLKQRAEYAKARMPREDDREPV